MPSNLTIENLPFKDKYPQRRTLKTPIKVLVPKDKELINNYSNLQKKTMAFWRYYQLETYDNKLVFKINQADFDVLLKKVRLFKPENSIDAKITLIFETIFNFFNNTVADTRKIKWHIF